MGLRATSGHHDVEAFGLIDRDGLTDEEVQELSAKGIFALDVTSVEALYYCSDAIDAVASRQADTMGHDARELNDAVVASALERLQDDDVVERLAARKCERRLRNAILAEIPDWKTIRARRVAQIDISVESPYEEELERIRSLVQERVFDELVTRYPIRESGVFDAVARALKLPNRKAYERAVLVQAQTNEQLAGSLRSRIGGLSSALGWEQGMGGEAE